MICKMQRSLVLVLITSMIIQGDITNLEDFRRLTGQNLSYQYPVGFLSQANFDVVKRHLPFNIEQKMFKSKIDMLKAVDDEKIVAGITTGRLSEDLEPKYHVFSSLVVSPQAMLLAPDYDSRLTPYVLQNTSSRDLFDALNAAINEVQREGIDETLLSANHRTGLVRVYSCEQNSSLYVPNRNETSGSLRDILFNTKTLNIGGIGPSDWGAHDGNYILNASAGFYPELLIAIVDKFRKLKGLDGDPYGENIVLNRSYYDTTELLLQAVLNGAVHATDIYVVINAPFTIQGAACVNNSQCGTQGTCKEGVCNYPTRPRSLQFRSTCTTASGDSKFVTKKDSSYLKSNATNQAISSPSDTNRQTPRTRYIGFLLLFITLFGAMFLGLVVLMRRKKNYRIQHTFQGGFGKFARLQEDAEPPMEGMDAFDDHIVQSPRDENHSGS